MRYLVYIALVAALSGCSKRTLIASEEESFEQFYISFHEDESFQLSRVKFPLEGKLYSLEGSQSWSKKDWIPHVQKVTDITDPDYDTNIIRKELEVIDKVRLRETGFSIERRFQKIKGKWYLVYYQTINL